MCAFIVNPSIRHDADYYRHDDAVVDQVLSGTSKLVVGLRRSGKTSFLYRIERAARARGLPCVYLELADATDADLPALAEARVVLLDEAEILHTWEVARLERLVKAVRKATVVVTCAPQFILELGREADCVQRFVEGLDRHVLGPLSDAETRALLAHDKRPDAAPLGEPAVAELLATSERLAILVQALGAERAGTAELAVSLGGFGARVLTGLTETARRILVDAAHDLPVPDGEEARLLVKTGALRRTTGARGGGKDDRSIRISSELLAELIRKASHRTEPGSAGREPVPAPRREEPAWQRHARLVHLSDLHFGRQAIDAPDVQARRLIAALERDDRIPDFLVVTGDLSWSGHRNELRDAEQFLDRLVAWLSAKRQWSELETRRRVIIVPGNHEASWCLSSGIGAGTPPTSEDIEHWVRFSLGPFANFVNRFYRLSTFWDLDALCLAQTFAEPSIAFVSLSTAHYITQTARDAVFGPQLRARAVELLARDDVQRARFRLGVWHHNLRPFHNEIGNIADVDVAVRDFLRVKPSLDLALHGHVHQGEVDVYLPRGGGPALTYSAVGSFGVAADHRPGDDRRGRVHNEFAVVDLHTSGAGRRVQTEFYELKPDANAEWRWERARTWDPKHL